MNKEHLPKKSLHIMQKSPTALDAFQQLQGLISCAEVNGDWEMLSRAPAEWNQVAGLIQNVGRSASVQLSFVQLYFVQKL